MTESSRAAKEGLIAGEGKFESCTNKVKVEYA